VGSEREPGGSPPSERVVVRVDTSDSEDAWGMTETPSDSGGRSASEGPSISTSAAEALLRAVAASSGDAEPEPDRTGRRLSHYQVVRKIGQGGMGIVYAADDVRLRRRVALKVLPVRVVADEARRKRFLREARSASAVQHPNVATIFDVGEDDGTVWLAMELVEGSTLRAALRERGGPLEVPRALAIATQIAKGLARAHAAGIVHRDVKPENVMIAPDGTAKLLDFGLAKLAGEGDERPAALDEGSVEDFASQSGHVLGTPAYMSPEQADGRAVDARTDVFALGIVLFEMVSGQRPSRGSSFLPLPRLPGVAAPIARTIERCLRPVPSERFADARALVAELEEHARAPAGRSRFVAAAAGAAALGAIALLATRDPSSPPPTARHDPSPSTPTAPSAALGRDLPVAAAPTQTAAPAPASALSPSSVPTPKAPPRRPAPAPRRPPPSKPPPPPAEDPLAQQK
jgi:serine/threonine-protein kinase